MLKTFLILGQYVHVPQEMSFNRALGPHPLHAPLRRYVTEGGFRDIPKDFRRLWARGATTPPFRRSAISRSGTICVVFRNYPYGALKRDSYCPFSISIHLQGQVRCSWKAPPTTGMPLPPLPPLPGFEEQAAGLGFVVYLEVQGNDL